MNFQTRCDIPGYELFNVDYLIYNHLILKRRELTKTHA